MKNIIITLILTALVYCNITIAMPDNDVTKTISLLRLHTSQYQQHQNDVQWLIRYEIFIKTQVLDSSNYPQISETVCLLRPLYYQTCISKALGFYSTIDGLYDSLHFTLKNCRQMPTDPNCPEYEEMLNNDVTQLKYLLLLKN